MSKPIYEMTLTEALPDSISGDAGVQAVCTGVDGQVIAMCEQIDVPAWMSRIQTMSSDELDHVAYTFGSHVWMRDWTLEQKRAYIVGVVARKKIIGTPAAIIDVFAQLGYDVHYDDCMSLVAMQPGSFLVSLVNEPVPTDDQWQLRWIVDNVKPASRSWRWDNRIEARSALKAGGGCHFVLWSRQHSVAVYPEGDPVPPVDPASFTVGVDTYVGEATEIYSDWFWALGFANGSLTNMYSPERFCCNILNNDTTDNTVPNDEYSAAKVIGNNGVMLDFAEAASLNMTQFRLWSYNEAPEFYTNASSEGSEVPDVGSNSALVVLPAVGCTSIEPGRHRLPDDAYSIMDGQLQWHTWHPVVMLLMGVQFYTEP